MKDNFKIINRYVNSKFSTQNTDTEKKYGFLTKVVVEDGIEVTLQIYDWDINHQSRFQSIGICHYRGTNCCVLVYDITNPKSFESLDSWRDEFLMQGSPKDPENFPFVVLGNKSDKQNERKVDTVRAQKWCKTHNQIDFFETSATESNNVEVAFQQIAKTACSQSKDEDFMFPTSVPLNKNQKVQQSQGCNSGSC